MSKSPLVEYEHISPFRNSPRNQPISKVTWHHCAGVLSLEQFDAIVHKPGRNMSSNYCVDKDARVGLFCPEEDRCWCSSSAWNDNRAVVLEISNSKTGGNWPISDAVYAKCIELTVDICKRNGIKKLTYTGDKNGSLTFHRFFAATGCLPIDTTEVLTKRGWMFLRDVNVGDLIATVSPKNLQLTFAHVQNMVPVKRDSVYTQYGMTVTGDHRVLYNGVSNNGNEFDSFENLKGKEFYIPSAAMSSRDGIQMSSSEMIFVLEMKKLGHINKDTGALEFTYVVESRKEWFQSLLKNIGFEYERIQEDLGPVRFTITDERALELVDRFLVDGKDFNWRWLDMSPTQFSYFIYKVTHHVNGGWDRTYTSESVTNIDIVQAVCALNNRGTYYDENTNTLYVTEPYRKIDGSHVIDITEDVEVSCVTVETGAFLIRQNGYVTVTGNCPGPYIFAKAQEICDLVNAQLEEKPEPTPEPEPTPTTDIGKGDLVSIMKGATYYNGASLVPTWVLNQNWYVSSISGDRAVLGKNESGTSDIQSPIKTKFLTVVKKATTPTPTPVTNVPYTTRLTKGTPIYKISGTTVTRASSVATTGTYTIVQEKSIGTKKYGYLKSGAGWVSVGSTPVDNTIKVGDYVKVLNGVTYDGKKFVIYEKKYKVLQVSGDRIVISADGKNVTAAVKASNCQKV